MGIEIRIQEGDLCFFAVNWPFTCSQIHQLPSLSTFVFWFTESSDLQLGVFHGSRADAGKSAFLEFLCFLCHANLLFSFAYRAVEPGFAMYISGSCASRGKTLVQDIGACSKAMRVRP